MTGVADEFRFFLDERIMRGLIGGIEYGLHVFQPTQSRRPSVRFFLYRFMRSLTRRR